MRLEDKVDRAIQKIKLIDWQSFDELKIFSYKILA